jgi:hypothetical protein
LGGGEALIAVFPETTNEIAYVARATGSFFLGFSAWYLFMEWWYRVLPCKKAERDDDVQRVGAIRTVLNICYKFAAVFLVPCTSRWMETYTGSAESPLQKFVSNAWFIVMWFQFYRVSNLINGEYA